MLAHAHARFLAHLPRYLHNLSFAFPSPSLCIFSTKRPYLCSHMAGAEDPEAASGFQGTLG